MPQRDTLLIASSSTTTDHRMEGGLQQRKITLVIGQYYAERIRYENGLAKTGRIRSKTNRRILQMTGGELGRRSITIHKINIIFPH